MFFSLLSCNCRHRSQSPRNSDAAEVSKANPPLVEPKREAKKPEERICPITGAIGYCPMARPPPGTKLPDVKPELKVLMFLMWENDGDKVSVGVYPHMSQHWDALGLADTSTKQEIKTQYHKLSIKYHPDKNKDEGAAERFKQINEAYQALKDVDGSLAFPWDKYPERQHVMSGADVLKTFGFLAGEAARMDPIKAQMMQHVVKEATDCKVLMHEQETVSEEFVTKETWADGLCVDSKNGSNHLVQCYRRIVTMNEDENEETQSQPSTAAETADIN